MVTCKWCWHWIGAVSIGQWFLEVDRVLRPGQCLVPLDLQHALHCLLATCNLACKLQIYQARQARASLRYNF